MTDQQLHHREFERQRPRLRSLAARILDSTTEAEDVLQEAWLRLERTETRDIQDLGAWLTTVTSRLCLDVLRSPRYTREQSWHVGLWRDPSDEPSATAIRNDNVTTALIVVLDALHPVERLAFVLHDVFGLSFAEISNVLNRSPDAARQIASRARRRVKGQNVCIARACQGLPAQPFRAHNPSSALSSVP